MGVTRERERRTGGAALDAAGVRGGGAVLAARVSDARVRLARLHVHCNRRRISQRASKLSRIETAPADNRSLVRLVPHFSRQMCNTAPMGPV